MQSEMRTVYGQAVCKCWKYLITVSPLVVNLQITEKACLVTSSHSRIREKPLSAMTSLRTTRFLECLISQGKEEKEQNTPFMRENFILSSIMPTLDLFFTVKADETYHVSTETI